MLEDLPDPGPLRSGQRPAPPRPGHLQVLVLGLNAVGLDHLLPLLAEEAGVPRRSVASTDAPPPSTPRWSSGLAISTVDALAPQEAHGPGVQMDHLDAIHALRAERREHLLDVLGQVRREGREQDAVGLLREDLGGQVLGPVHRHHRLARACAAQTLAGPLKFLATSFSWLGCRKTRHFSSGASRMAVKSLSDRMVTNRRRVSGCSRAAARSPVSTFSFLGWATAARISSGRHALGQPHQGLGAFGRQVLVQGQEFVGCRAPPARRAAGWPAGRRRAAGRRRTGSNKPAGLLLVRLGRHDLFRLG